MGTYWFLAVHFASVLCCLFVFDGTMVADDLLAFPFCKLMCLIPDLEGLLISAVLKNSCYYQSRVLHD